MPENADAAELDKFGKMASRWWDPQGDMKPLHEINPLRLEWIAGHLPGRSFTGLQVVDIGCGGGLLAEGMAAAGGVVTGLDLSQRALGVAKLHLLESGQQVDYRLCSAEAHAEERPADYDVVTCLEMLEHVPDPKRVVDAAAQLVKPGGWLFFSTLNRNPKAYLFAVLGAEYLLRLLPRGTHDYARFIRPSELIDWIETAGLLAAEIKGVGYNPIMRHYRLSDDASVNYLLAARCQK